MCLYSGFFGHIDSARVKSIKDRILSIAENSETDNIIIDLSNVDLLDSSFEGQMIKLNKLLSLIGMDVVFAE